MKENFDSALEAILHHEGGYVNHPADPGGMTNLGVTKRVWEEWVGHEVDEKTMRALTPEIVGPMYKAKYWDKIKGDDLPAGVDYIVFDAAINSGPGRAAKCYSKPWGRLQTGLLAPARWVRWRLCLRTILWKNTSKFAWSFCDPSQLGAPLEEGGVAGSKMSKSLPSR